MNEGAWSRFLEHAAHARTKPTFAVEERQPKLATAAALRRTLETARDGGEWPALLAEALRPRSPNPFEANRNRVVPPRQARWTNEWARREPDAVREVLAGFLDQGAQPIERFAAFAAVAEPAIAAGRTDDDPEGVLGLTATLTLGSLFTFAVEPESLPIVRGYLDQLRVLLGVEPAAGTGLVERYGDQLAFAQEAATRMNAHGVETTDMIDVQSLMQIGVQEAALWSQDPPARAPAERRLRPDATYLAACSVYLDEAPYLREWIEFHRLVGVERFFLYDNGSRDHHLEVLAPYVERGIVVLHEWPASPLDQRDVYEACLRDHREDARWVAFIDIDEFLFSPAGDGVAELLRDFERWPGVGVNWAMFSHSGHRTAPDGLVIESYPLRDTAENGLIKCIVDPARAVRCDSAHWFTFDHGLPVDENQWPITGPQTKSTSFERLRINHYASRSEEELLKKAERRTGWMHLRRWRWHDLHGELDLVRDESIMQWAPALEAALRRGGA
jgi:Glycosyltransferase family 92